MIDLTQFGGTNQDIDDLLERKQARRSETRAVKKKVANRRPIPKHEQGTRFVRGPVPYEWLRVALSHDGKAGNLAWAIWWLAGVERSNPIRLTRRVLCNFNISTRAARRLLFAFERSGLVEVDRKRGRGPIVTLLTPKQESAADE